MVIICKGLIRILKKMTRNEGSFKKGNKGSLKRKSDKINKITYPWSIGGVSPYRNFLIYFLNKINLDTPLIRIGAVSDHICISVRIR